MSGSFEKRSKRTAVSKALMLVVAFVLVIGISVVGTLAWLTAQTPEVKNTFTSAELFANPTTDFTLWEYQAEDTDGDGRYTLNTTEVQGNSYDILPGVNIPKNPTVDVVNLEEHAYLYIKVTGLPMANGLTATVDTANWTALGDSYPGVYVYRGSNAENNIVKATDAAKKSFTATILTDNQIVVAADYAGTADDITLSFQAYMVQATGNGDSAAAAWENTYGTTTP